MERNYVTVALCMHTAPLKLRPYGAIQIYLLLLLLLLLQYQHKFTHVSNEPTSVITTLNFRLLNRQYIASPTREDQATATGNMHEHLERGSGDMLAHRRTNRRVHHNTPLPTDCVMTIGCIASYA